MTINRLTALELWGKELARAREKASMSGPQLAKAIYVSPSLIGMWELGKRAPKPQDIARCDEILGTGGYISRLLTDWVSREVPHEWLGKWLLIEEGATSLLSFESTVVPGLAQTEAYARAILQQGRSDLGGTEELLTARLERQRILRREKPPLLVALMAESVLRHMVGTPDVMREQLLYLTEAAESQDVVINVIPASSPVCAGFTGPFVIAGYDGQDVAYVDNQLAGEVKEAPEDVAALRRMFEKFRADALNKGQSIKLIQRMAEQWTD